MGQDREDREDDDADVTIETAPQRSAVFQREVREALRYEEGLVVKALLVLAAVAVIVILRTLYFALPALQTARGLPIMAWLEGMRGRVVIASTLALALAAASLTVALVAAAGARADGRELSQRLEPAALAAVNLLDFYQAQQTWLRGYVTSGHPGPLTTFDDETTHIETVQDQIMRLAHGYQTITDQLNVTRVKYEAWLGDIAGPQLAAMSLPDVGAARALQADTGHVRSFVLPVQSAGADLQDDITRKQQAVTNQLNDSQHTLLAALIAMCVVVAAIVANALAAVWLGLLRPFGALRRAMASVTAGDYDTRIPAVGPAELAGLGRGIELMRLRLVAALADLQQAEQRFRFLFDAAPDAMIAVAEDGSIAMANSQAVQLFGYPVGNLVGQPVEMLIPEEARTDLAAERVGYFAAPPSRAVDAELKVSGLRRDGSRFPAEITLSSLPTESGMLVAAAIRDVSERLAMEAERERLRAAAEQERVNRRLQQSQRLESLGQLVGGVAHDFNNLLNVIQGYADFTAEQIQPLAQADTRLVPVLDDIEQVRAAAQQAARLTRQLLTFARHDVTRPEVVDLNEAVHGAGQLLRRTLGEHIDLVITTEPALWRVKADRGQLEQVLMNLAVNARDAMPGGGRLSIDTGNTEVDATYATRRPGLTPGRYARLRVSDTGMGMDQATAERVFEPFFSTKPKGRGTGLGLATVYGIVTGADGSIEIYSELGLGTTVSVLLPVTDEDVAPEAPPVVVAGDDQRGHGETILLVEDEESLRKLTSRILTRSGYHVCAAASGSEAVQRASDPAQPIDLLLTDVVMPEMLGNEVAARVQAARPGVPALFISGYAQPILDSHGVPSPRYDILEKPFTEAALLTRVRRAMKAPRSASAG
jgi:PAS domain S-box-containing protein